MKASTVTTFKKVVGYLHADDKYKDDDQLLVARFWYDEMKAIGVDMSQPVKPHETMMYFVKGKLTRYETITRCRRKAQEEYPGLRGKTYYDRKNRKTEVVKSEMRELTRTA